MLKSHSYKTVVIIIKKCYDIMGKQQIIGMKFKQNSTFDVQRTLIHKHTHTTQDLKRNLQLYKSNKRRKPTNEL